MAKGLCIALNLVLLSLCPGCVAPLNEQMLTMKGSDTMVLLGQRWAEVYMKEHPESTIQVTGGGSGTGIAALINSTTQIAQSSRPMKEEEKAAVREQRGVDVVETPVALDALAVYIHSQNPVESLTMEQIRRIYQAQITNWKEVGGPDLNVVLYGRENSSGTYVYFKEEVLGNGDFATTYQALPGTAAVINAVTRDPGGIGYGGIGYATELKAIPIAPAEGAGAVTPTMDNVLQNRYPLSRQLFWYTAGEPQGIAGAFLDWVLSPEGQKLVSEVGYYPLQTFTTNR